MKHSNYDDYASANTYWNEINQAANDITSGDYDDSDYDGGDHFAEVWVNESGYYDNLSDDMRADLFAAVSNKF